MDALIGYSWPGNVRELENIVEQIMILSEKEVINVEDLPSSIRKGKGNPLSNDNTSLKGMMDQYEKNIFEELLSEKLSVAQMSRILGVDVTTIRRKLQKYELSLME
jgi:transcriptional regulator with PAS, ATPase and Fis domain